MQRQQRSHKWRHRQPFSRSYIQHKLHVDVRRRAPPRGAARCLWVASRCVAVWTRRSADGGAGAMFRTRLRSVRPWIPRGHFSYVGVKRKGKQRSCTSWYIRRMNCANCSVSLRRKKLTRFLIVSYIRAFWQFLPRHIVLMRWSVASFSILFCFSLFVFVSPAKVNKVVKFCLSLNCAAVVLTFGPILSSTSRVHLLLSLMLLLEPNV